MLLTVITFELKYEVIFVKNVIFFKSQGEPGKLGPPGYRGDEGPLGQEVRDFEN